MRFIVKNTTKINIFDLLAPHSCRGCGALGSVLCERCKNNLISNQVSAKGHLPVHCIGRREGILATLIHDYKYHSTRAIAPILAELLDKTLPSIKGPVVIVPLPTIPRHIRERGLDHTYKIAKNLTKRRSKNYQVEKLLIRNNNTVQVGTDRKTRLIQAQEAYKLKSNAIIDQSATYVLFDDVWTTGASMKAALKILQQAGVSKVIISVLAIS